VSYGNPVEARLESERESLQLFRILAVWLPAASAALFVFIYVITPPSHRTISLAALSPALFACLYMWWLGRYRFAGQAVASAGGITYTTLYGRTASVPWSDVRSVRRAQKRLRVSLLGRRSDIALPDDRENEVAFLAIMRHYLPADRFDARSGF
jgi:hypothetical protein